MSKVLKIAGEIVAVAAIAVATAGVGLAVVAGASLGAAVAGAGAIFAGTIGISLGTALAIGAGLTLAGGLLAKQPQVSPSQVDRTHVSLILDTPRKMVLGHTALATDLRYQEFFGNNQENCAQVLLLASHWCESVEQVWLNDVLAWTATGGTQGIYTAYFYVKYFAQAASGNSFVSGWSHRWGANAAFVGCATVYLEFKTTPNSSHGTSPFSGSIPTRITIRGKGARVYDPRLDSTAGGAGSHRVADQATWQWTAAGVELGRNPALCLLFYLLGWHIQNPSTGAMKLAVGLGIPADRIDIGSFITGANMCDEQITLAIGGTEPRYRCDGMFSEGDDPGTVITALESAMNAKLRDSAGRFTLQVLHDDLSTPVLDFTEDDVLDGFTWDQGGALTDVKNVIKGRYTDPSDQSLYQLVDYPPVSILAIDGIDRIDNFDLGVVQSPSQAQRLAKQRLERYQYPGTFAASFKARAWALKDGDVVRLTFAPLGFYQKLMRITKATIQVSGEVPLVMAEESPAIYAWDASEIPAITAAAPIVFDPNNNATVQAIGAISTAALQSVIATSFPIGLTITAAADGTVTISDSTRRYTDGHADVPVTGATLATGLSPGTFRAIGYDDPDRQGAGVTYQLFASDIDARVSPANPGRHYVGYATIPTAGSPPADGGGASPPGGDCVTVDTPIMMADGSQKPAGQIVVGDRVWTRHEDHLIDVGGGWGVYPIEAITTAASDDVWQATIGGRVLQATGDHLVYTGAWVAMRDLGHQVAAADVVKMTVTSAHTYVSNGILSHNIKQNQLIA